MLRQLQNQKGFAIIYALVVLLLASVGGTALLFMTRIARTNAVDYGKMRVVSQAAMAALKACEGQFYNDPETSLEILKKFIADDHDKWLLGGIDETGSENRLTLGDFAGAPEYSARIVGFDENNCFLKVEGTGFGNTGGKKRVIATYQLNGLAMVAPSVATANRYAIYIKNEGENFNLPATINGDVYFGAQFQIQAGQGPTVINGNLKTAPGSGFSEVLSALNINGNAFFQSPVTFNNKQSSISGSVGFDDCAYFGYSPVALSVGGDAYFNSTINTGCAGSASGKIGMNNNNVTYNVSINQSYIQDASAIQSNGGAIDIASEVGMCDGAEDPISFDLSSIDKSVSYTDIFGSYWNPWTCATLNNYYDNNPGKLWNDYLVIRVNSQCGLWNSPSGTFTKKVIWIFETSSPVSNQLAFYTSDPGSVSLMYIGNNVYVDPLKWNGLFRGIIYVSGTGKVQYQLDGQVLQGALIHDAVYVNDDCFEMQGSAGITITYDDEVDTMIDEFVNLGIATRPPACSGGGGGDGSGGNAVLTLTDTRIRPTVMGIQL